MALSEVGPPSLSSTAVVKKKKKKKIESAKNCEVTVKEKRMSF